MNNGPWASLARSRYLWANGTFVYQLHSSIWTAIRDWREILNESAVWWLGDGKSISFWKDTWLDAPLADMAALDSQLRLEAKVYDFIHNMQWLIPHELEDLFPNIVAKIRVVSIPVYPQMDKLIWRSSPSGDLSFKSAYEFVVGNHPCVTWSKKV